MASLGLILKTDKSQSDLQDLFTNSNDQAETVKQRLAQFFRDLQSGTTRANIDIYEGSAAPVAASATLTLVSAVATDEITIGPVTFTATSTPSAETDWEIDGATDADDATSLAAAINAHSTVSQVVTASAASNVVTVTCNFKGVVGNFINISSADATITASAANLGSGAGVTSDPTNHNFGIT